MGRVTWLLDSKWEWAGYMLTKVEGSLLKITLKSIE